jgi:predicted nucleotidyltransferase
MTIMYDLSPQMDAIKRACIDSGVNTLEMVGSAARTDFNPESSDVDLLVTFKGRDRLFDRYFSLKIRLEELLARPVDLIQPAGLRNPIVKKNIEQNRVPLYGA